jgi:prophage antirepressor-like protein
MSDSSLTVFSFESNNVRVVSIDGEPWFVAKDICDVLEHSNSRAALERLKDYEKGVSSIYTLGGNQDMAIISESGLYRLVLTSRKPQAEPFQDWVCQDVIPSVRKTGSYSIAPTEPELSPARAILKMAEFMVEQEEKTRQLEAKLALEAQRSDRLEEIIKQHDAELDRVFNPDGNFYTVRGYASLKGLSLSMSEAIAYGRKATKLSKDLGYRKDEVNDPRYGKVGMYSEHVLDQIFA